MSKTPSHATAGTDGIYLPKQRVLEKQATDEAFKRFFDKRGISRQSAREVPRRMNQD